MHPLSPGTTTEGALAAYKGECLHGVIVLFNRTMKFARAALLASGCLACSGLRDLNSPNDGRAARGRTRVSMGEVRAEIDKYTCAAWSQEINQWDITILSDSCVTTRDAKIGDAVRDVVQRASVLLPLASVAYERFDGSATQPGLTPASADALARNSVWSDPVLMRGILLQVDRSVREHDWDCRDCTATEPPARFEVSWEEFLPYLFAYLWPVQTPEGPVDLFVCSGTNGVADLPALEPLRQEGFLVAAAFAQHEPIAVELERIRARHNAGQTRSADGLAREVHAFVRSAAGQSHACGAAEGVEWFTGVVVRECVGPKL